MNYFVARSNYFILFYLIINYYYLAAKSLLFIYLFIIYYYLIENKTNKESFTMTNLEIAAQKIVIIIYRLFLKKEGARLINHEKLSPAPIPTI